MNDLNKILKKENKKWPIKLIAVPKDQWPNTRLKLIEVLRSRNFLVQIYDEGNNIERLSVCRTLTRGGMWLDNITWDELQILKDESGRGNKAAVELYPSNSDVVNVANMRHLWVLPEAPEFMWKKK